MPLRQWLTIAPILAAVIGGAWWFQRSAPEAAPVIVDTRAEAVSAITVHVSGEVVAPGLVEVSADARVADAVAAAGGTTRDADLARVNLAAPIQDGQQVVIPTIGGGVTGSSERSDGKLALNAASVSELEQLPGVGPVLAERIAAHREENGPFGTVEDLLDVSGIGEAKLEALRDAVAVP